MHPTKQGVSEILGKMSFRNHHMEHTFSFNLIPNLFIPLHFEIGPFVYKTRSSFSGSVILRNQPLKFSIPYSLKYGYDRLQKIQNFFCEKLFENQSEITWR